MNVQAIALKSFDDSAIGRVRRGDALTLGARYARDLERAGLVQMQGEPALGKTTAPGVISPSSASPAGPASARTTSKRSGGGGKKRKAKAEPSSS